MKQRKSIVLIIITFLVLLVAGLWNTSKAATGSMYLNLKMLRSTGYGYQLANGTKNVWKIVETNASGTNASYDKTIYCLKGGPGFGTGDFTGSGTPQVTEYRRYFDMKDPSSIPSNYQNALPNVNSNTYKALLWVLDHCFVAPKSGASSQERDEARENREMLLKEVAEYAKKVGNSDVNENIVNLLTDDDVDATQQLAVWYFTNPDDAYHVTTFEFYVNIVAGTDANYKALSDDFLTDGWDRAYACQALFDYLVKTAEEKAPTYNYTQDNLTNAPVEIKKTSVTQKTVGNRTIVGPYRADEVRNITYTLEATFQDGNNNKITDVSFCDANGNILQGETIKSLLGRDFYIAVPSTTNTSNVMFGISGSYFKTLATYWSVENPTINDQPVVVVEKKRTIFADSVTSAESKFDLALRKFITSINGIAPTVSRVPTISAEEITKLKSGATTTAAKIHTKEPLLVKTGDKVVYTIRVYNEGNIDGYAKQITDHLPDGLKFLPTSSINQVNGWTNPSGDGKTIVSNGLQNKLLTAFNGTDLKSQDLQIECEVTASVVQNDQTLKNIAEISIHSNAIGDTTVVDRDSQPNNVVINNYGTTSQQDDDDFEPLVLLGKYFDLSLRKFITAVDKNGTTVNYNRAPVVDVSPLLSGSKTTAIYNHDKTPVGVDNGNIVTYTIRVYNEGQVDGYVNEITDHLPKQLEFIVDDSLNAKYGWTVSADGRTVKTTITSPDTTNSASRDSIYATRRTDSDKVLLTAFKNGTTLDYIDVQIRCKVKENIDLYQKITNIADITKFTDASKNTVIDRDSQQENVVLPTDDTLPNYKDTEIGRKDSYIPGQQDDDDFEKLVLQRFDLALRKFITGVNDTKITNRAPVFKKVSEKEYKYEHTKEPVEVANGNTVYYTLRIFNEGNVAGYASKVKDDLPVGLEFLPDNEINKTNRWKMYKEDGTQTTQVKEAKYIETDYLAKEQEKTAGDNLLKAFNPQTMTMPDYKDIQIAFKVTEANTSDRILINTAEITDDTDENGKPVEDIDSTPNNNKPEEDDIDIEKVKVKFFDLALKKWVTESIVTYDGKTTVTKTGHTGDENPEPPAKVEIRGSRISKTTVKFKFNIKVTNEGEIEGYVKQLIDYVPQGLKFEAKDNPKWKEVDGKIVTDQLKDTLLKPEESATVEIVLTWINNKNNLGLKTNWAEIYEDDNEYDSPDIDSTPGNNKKGEDDIDDAPVILSVVTGTAQTYTALFISTLGILTAGVVLIKKFVI